MSLENILGSLRDSSIKVSVSNFHSFLGKVGNLLVDKSP